MIKFSDLARWLSLALLLCSFLSPLTIKAADDQPEELWVPPKKWDPAAAAVSAKKPSPNLRSDAYNRKSHKEFRLEQLSSEQLKMKSAQTPGGRIKVGFNRDITDFQTKEQTQAELNWETSSEGGLIALTSFSSPSALALRLGLKIYKLPEQAELRFFSAPSNQGDVITGSEIMESVQKNLDAGDPESKARIYWSPVEKGETIGVEIYLPPGTGLGQVEISIPFLSHVFQAPGAEIDPYSPQALNADASIMASGTCNIDVRCYWPTWQEKSNSVGQMQFVDGLYSYICTGTLLNDTANSGTPYFLSADHCISTQTSASSLAINWFFYSTACDSGATNPNYKTTSGGADLLYHSNGTDTSFMRLRSIPPVGTTFSGWTTSKQPISTKSAGLHNPNGDLLKISTGQLSNYWDCTPPTSGRFTCSPNTDGNFANITWGLGTVEGGSSGSGIFTDSGQYIFGQLYGGNSSCSNLSGSNYYGRFDKAYLNGNLGQWLASQFQLSISKSGTGTGTVTSNPAGINCGSTCRANFDTGANVTLTANPSTGSIFDSWTGCNSTSGSTCNITLTANKAVTASFSNNALNEGIAGTSTTGQIWYTRDLNNWARATGELAQINAGSFSGLIGTTGLGSIWYTSNLSTWTPYSGTLKQAIAANLNGDNILDVAGVSFSGDIWYNLGGGWIRIPGSLTQIAAGDIDGDGKDDLVGVNSLGSIWYTTNLNNWTRIQGELAQVTTGDINGDNREDIAGVSSNGIVWYTRDLTNWTHIEANLIQIAIGDLNGDGFGDIAGLSPSGSIWYTTNLNVWAAIPGQLSQITIGNL